MYFFQCEKTIKDFSEQFHIELKNTKIEINKQRSYSANDTFKWFNIFTLGIVGWAADVVCKTQELTGNIRDCIMNRGKVSLSNYIGDDFKVDLRKTGLNLTELAEEIEAKSLKSIREKLAGIIKNVFAYLKGIFHHLKKIFYIVSILLMVYDGYM